MKGWKIALIVAGGLVVLGLIAGVIGASIMGFRFGSLSTAGAQTTETFAVEEDFENIQMNVTTGDVTILPSSDGSASVVCTHLENSAYQVKVENNTLIVEETIKNPAMFHFGSFEQRIEVYLPLPEYQDLKIEGTTCDVDVTMYFTFHDVAIDITTGDVGCRGQVTGDLHVKTTTGDIAISKCQPTSADLKVGTGNISALGIVTKGDVSAKATTGKIYLNFIKAANLNFETSTGDVTLDNVLIDQKMTGKTTTGHMSVTLCDAAELDLHTTTGDITGSVLTPKVFLTDTSSGDVSVPQTTTGGTCKLHTTTGDIDIQLAPES